ncbi:protein SCAI-like [Anneissia japonica]|uniref:protein SCAI-like n=1 Tax=Anneissia japonica TaxID=1529436 RepID=UPI00142556B9|nr:protein SCAI-like [Anneissia japonica]
MEGDNGITDDERKIVQEFSYLLEKSKQLFNGLRDLPQYGHKQWQSYFGRTFDVYTKLWKFQQQHRMILDTHYGLKRWQIGEVASKIGQLYYHYYLRTSETSYLMESFSFYSAIRARAYYSKVNKEKGPELMVKKLRYYARLIVVCLLLRKMDLIRELIKELSRHIDEYVTLFDTSDKMEWSLVLGEINAFIEADAQVTVVDKDAKQLTLSHRLSKDMLPPLEKGCPVYITLQEALIIGNSQEQVKFSELTLDMYRMLQTIEREPDPENSQSDHIIPESQDNLQKVSKKENPHKYLLYKPTFGQFYTFMGTAFKELPPNAALLLYMSADGSNGCEKPQDYGAYDYGGIATNNRKEGSEQRSNKPSGNLKEMHCVHPGDIYPFTRKPLFLIVDSPNSHVFKGIPNLFGQPVIILMSPVALPLTLQERCPMKGNLFTLFLSDPLMAFCSICDITDVPADLWAKCKKVMVKVVNDSANLLCKSRGIDHVYMQFYGDEFLRLFILRYVFCYATLRYHRGFKDESFYPQSHPDLRGNDIMENALLHKHVLELASILDVRSIFLEVGETD